MKTLSLVCLVTILNGCTAKSSDGPNEVCQSKIECLPYAHHQFLQRDGFVAHEGLELRECEVIVDEEGGVTTPYRNTVYLASPISHQSASSDEGRLFFLSRQWRDAQREFGPGMISTVHYVDTETPAYRSNTTFVCGERSYRPGENSIWAIRDLVSKPVEGLIHIDRGGFTSMPWDEYVGIAIEKDRAQGESFRQAGESTFRPVEEEVDVDSEPEERN